MQLHTLRATEDVYVLDSTPLLVESSESNYCSSDRDVGGLASSIARIVEIFSDTAVDDAARAIFMDDFIEEIAAAAVGDAEAAVLLRMCFIENNRSILCKSQ